MVPISPPFAQIKLPSVLLQEERFAANRSALLRELSLAPGLADGVRRLKVDSVYTVVLSRGRLQKGPEGLYSGVIRKRDGKILEHIKLKKVSLGVGQAAATCSTQMLLMKIAAQLQEVHREVERLRADLVIDRIATIEAGVRQYKDALCSRNPETRKHLLTNAIQSLSEGVERARRSLEVQVREAPDPQASWWRSVRGQTRRAKEKMALAEESFAACVYGIRIIAECYACLGEERAASQAVKSRLEDLANSCIDEAAKKARLVPYSGDGLLPEAVWRDFRVRACELVENMSGSDKALSCVQIEVRPKELGKV